MIDKHYLDLPLTPPAFAPSESSLPPLYDESLISIASSRLRDSSRDMKQLVADSPQVRDTLNGLLAQQLDVEGEHVAFLFPATNERTEQRISFTEACAYVVQHPALEPSIAEQCRVTGLAPTHRLANLSPSSMLEKLKALDPKGAHEQRWANFWQARAPRAAVSRQTRALQLYRDHFEAALQVAFALKTISRAELGTLLLVLDSPSSERPPDTHSRPTESVTLRLNDGSEVKPEGALVFSLADPSGSSLVLYLPGNAFAIQRFNRRSELEDWLRRRVHMPTGTSTDDMTTEYTVKTHPMEVAATDFLAQRQQAQVTALSNASSGESSLAEHGAGALAAVDQLYRQQHHTDILAAPPEAIGPVAPQDTDADTAEKSLFGNLSAGIPWSLRQAALGQQRAALQTLVNSVGNTEGLQPFKDSLSALEKSEEAAEKAASALLYRARVLDLITFQREFNALHGAHKAGLHAEVALQLALKQLTEDDARLLKSVLDPTDNPGAESVAASLTLAMSEKNEETTTASPHELKGVFIVARPEALTDASAAQSVLLYWPGAGGGLQRFANRRELERQVFKIGEGDRDLTLQLKKIGGDVLLYSLNKLVSDFEEEFGAIRQRHPEPTEVALRDEQLDALRLRALATLQVPVHEARSLAFSHLIEQNRSGTLADHLPSWLTGLSEAQRLHLKGLIEAYMQAMHRSHALMTTALEPRDDFTRKHLYARLRKDFSLKGHFSVRLTLPDAVHWEKQYSSAPSGPVPSSVMVASAQRSTITLEELAQLNLDNVNSEQKDQVSLRLVFMQLHVSAADNKERQRLHNRIDVRYLRKILPELDLPKAYERLIYDTFKGASSEATFVKEHRHETLVEPWRLMLKLQGECAHLQQQITRDDLNIFNIAIDASTPQAWNAHNRRIVLLPAYLSVGGKDTPNEGPVSLSGITFIQEQISGATLLYLPDSPDDQFLRRYDNLESARKSLYNLCLHDKWVSYVAGRALQGNARAHESRINQATLKHFDALIGVGTRWPTHTSMAAHLLNTHMGRLIEAHRDTSRSNDALYLERYALSGPRAFNYMKMAIGVVPFVGTVLSLYNAWNAANQAAAAFLRGEVGDGLAEVESMLWALIDAAMDLLPGEAITSGLSRTARGLTRARQLHRLVSNVATVHGLSQRQARHVAKRFSGYEYEKPLSLAALQTANQGLYRGIYRHADGDFVERQGRIYQVQLSEDSRSWRLFGNSQKTYKQPIALNETGHWDTWFGVYGTTLDGGGLGGGQVLGHLADAFDPVWPPAVRQRLPRWWADRIYRRRQLLDDSIPLESGKLKAQVEKTNRLIDLYIAGDEAHKRSLLESLDASLRDDIVQAKALFRDCAERLDAGTVSTPARVRLVASKSNSAMIIVDRFAAQYDLRNKRIAMTAENIQEIGSQRLAAVDQFQILRLTKQRQGQAAKLLAEYEGLETGFREIEKWLPHVTDRTQKAAILARLSSLDRSRRLAEMPFRKSLPLLDLISHYENMADLSWLYLHTQMREARIRLDRALGNQHALPKALTTPTQRRTILGECLDTYEQFTHDLRIWTAGYPQHFNQQYQQPLLDIVEKMQEEARKSIKRAPVAPTKTTRETFETTDGKLLIGTQSTSPGMNKRYTVELATGHVETWEKKSNGKFGLVESTPAAPLRHVQDNVKTFMVSEARQRLENVERYVAKVDAYARDSMLPVDVEEMMVREASELTQRSYRIERLDSQAPLIAQLRAKAVELSANGRTLRTRQSLRTNKPTDGMLDDLIRQNAVQIRKNKPIQNLSKPKERADFMQEYEVWDLTQTPAKVVWYAHFHYSKAAPDFGDFEKAHLKLPEHLSLTHADNPDLPYADIGKHSAVLAHFEHL